METQLHNFLQIYLSFSEVHDENITFSENRFHICNISREKKEESEFLMASQNSYPR